MFNIFQIIIYSNYLIIIIIFLLWIVYARVIRSQRPSKVVHKVAQCSETNENKFSDL